MHERHTDEQLWLLAAREVCHLERATQAVPLTLWQVCSRLFVRVQK